MCYVVRRTESNMFTSTRSVLLVYNRASVLFSIASFRWFYCQLETFPTFLIPPPPPPEREAKYMEKARHPQH